MNVAQTLAEGLKKNVFQLNKLDMVEKNGYSLTVSIGASTMLPERGAPPENLVVAVDEAIYNAKKQERGRIVNAS